MPIAGATSAQMPEFSATGFLCAELSRAAKPTQKVFVYLRRRTEAEVVGVEREW